MFVRVCLILILCIFRTVETYIICEEVIGVFVSYGGLKLTVKAALFSGFLYARCTSTLEDF